MDPDHDQATGKLVRHCLSLSEFEHHIVHRTGTKHQADVLLSSLKPKSKYKSRLDFTVSVLTIFQNVSASVPMTGAPDFIISLKHLWAHK